MSVHMKILLMVAAAVQLFFCSKPTGNDAEGGGGSETGNVAFISGHLYTADGAPASGAKVCFVLHNNNPSAGPGIVDSATTDTAGWFGVDSLAADTYYVYGAGMDGDLSMQGPLMLGDDSAVIGPDTLKEPGSVSGVIQLQPGDDPRTVFVLVMGSVDFTMAEYDGAFSIAHLAEGEYRIRFLSTLDAYAPLEITVTVATGNVTALSEPVVLPYGGIPVPTGLTVSYDTLKQIVTLTWDRADTGVVAGCNVYRTLAGNSYPAEPLNGLVLVSDTVYRDSSGVQDETYEYTIAAVDENDNEGNKCTGTEIHAAGMYEYVFSFGRNGTGSGQFSGAVGIAISPQDEIYTIETGSNRVQKFSISGEYLLEWGAQGSDSGQFNIPFGIAVDTSGFVYVADRDNNRMQKFDPVGNVMLIIDTLVKQCDDVAVDNSGNIFIAGQVDYVNTVWKFDGSGDFITSWSSSISYSNPSLALGPDGTVYLSAANIVEVYSGSNRVDTWAYIASRSGIYSREIICDGTGGVMVSEAGETDMVYMLAADGGYIGRWGVKGTDPGELNNIHGMAIDSNGRVFVIGGNQRVDCFSKR